jgi:hypothetical protein
MTDLSPLDEPPDAPFDELRRRERAWSSSRRASDLWPGLDATLLQSAADVIGACVAVVLRGERASIDLSHLEGDAERRTRALGVAGLLTGVGPLLGAWVELGLVGADERAGRVLARHLAHGRARIARMRSGVMPLLARLERDGFAPGVIKGFHTAHAYFPEPGVRPMTDVDVVVAPGALPRVEPILRELGFTPGERVLRGHAHQWLPPRADGGAWSHELWHARSQWHVEPHDGLNFAAVVANTDVPQTARLGDWLTIGGTTLRVADPAELVATLATHGSTELYSSRLLRLVELVLVIRTARARGTLDWSGVEEHLARRDTLRFAFPSLTLVERLAPGTVDERLLSRVRDTTSPRIRAVTAHFTPTAPILDQPFSLGERLLWTSGIRGTLRRLWLMLVPLEGAPAGTRLRTYGHRAARLLAMTARVLRGRARSSNGGS